MAPKKSIKSSLIWNFFTEKPKADKIATCNICKQELTFKSTSNNLRKHMERKHPLVNLNTSRQQASTDNQISQINTPSTSKNTRQKVNDTSDDDDGIIPTQESASISTATNSKTGPIQTNVGSFLRRKMGVTAQKQIDEKLMLMFTHDFQPFSLVEDYGFKTFVSALNPSYHLFSRKTLTKTLLPAQFQAIYNTTKDIIAEVKSVTLTTDCWTSRNAENFLAVTVHFIDSNFVAQSLLLECTSFGETHTSKNLAGAIKNIIEEWHLEEKILMVISDNAANIKKAIKDELHLKHLGCYAHTINLIAHDSLKQISDILDKVKTIVGFFRRSTSATTKLLEQQKQLDREPKKLVQDVPTRWNSTYYMLERFIELEVPIKTTMALLDKDLPIISVEEWEFLKEIVKILQPLETITKVMSGQKYVTASSVIVLSDGLHAVYSELKSNRGFNALSMAVINSILEGIKTRLGDLENSNSLLITTFLDPRFKTVAFSSEAVAERAKKLVTSLATGNIKQANLDTSQPSAVQTNHSEENNTENSIWKSFDRKKASIQPSGTPFSKAIIEIQRYLEEPRISREEDPVSWWKNNSYNFPNLSKLVQERFITIATSVPCERQFSKSGLVLSDRRSRLSSTKVKQLLFINSNQKTK